MCWECNNKDQTKQQKSLNFFLYLFIPFPRSYSRIASTRFPPPLTNGTTRIPPTNKPNSRRQRVAADQKRPLHATPNAFDNDVCSYFLRSLLSLRVSVSVCGSVRVSVRSIFSISHRKRYPLCLFRCYLSLNRRRFDSGT